MLRLLTIAARNVLRNRRRSALTVAAVLLGVAASIILRGLAGGALEGISRRLYEGRMGAIQIHRAGFLTAEKDPLALDLGDDAALVDRIRAVAGISALAPRITFEAMISNGAHSTMALVTAVDPRLELTVCPGRWASVATQGLSGSVPGGAIIGRTLSEGLGAGKGGSLTLLATTRAGASNAMDLTVEDLMGIATPLDSKRTVIVDLAWAKALLGMEGRVTEYAVAVERADDLEGTADRLRAALGPGFEVSTWWDLMPQVRDIIGRLKIVLGSLMSVLFLLALSGVVNTMLMSVYERVREIGTMLAVGVRRRQIVLLFIAESATLGVAGGVAGAALGSMVVGLLGRRGLALRPPGADVELLLRPEAPPSFAVGALALALLGALLAAIYPAWRASRLTPVEALRSL